MLTYADVNSNLMQLSVFYKSCFPGIVALDKVKNKAMQKTGIDTIITLGNGKQISFDEKIRSKDYGDILLEEISVWHNYPTLNGHRVERTQIIPDILVENSHLKPGWTRKDSYTDYITYVIVPARRVYFLPFLLLRRAFDKYYPQWLKDSGGRKPTLNRDGMGGIAYYTTNIAVPTVTLYEAIYEMSSWPEQNKVAKDFAALVKGGVQLSLLS